ncbi:MAG: 30S ribosomal protein S5 [Candidatus Omnitrophica bacterium]|nr:30S ribosomal protein S5 [Candidatus Omnitrophota bacterium]
MLEEEKKDTGASEREAAAVKNTVTTEAKKTQKAPAFVPRKRAFKANESDGIERVIKINRVSKVVKGGKNFSFSALVVTGDGKGNVGMGFGKSNEVVEAIKKGTSKSKKSLFQVNVAGDTIPHEVIGVFKASRIMLKPAGAGTGVIAGGPVRALCDAVGIKNILTKSLGSRNAINVVRATINGFKKLRLKRRV